MRSAKQVLYSRSLCCGTKNIARIKMVTHAQGGVAGEGGW